ncbi:MAG: response regulator [Chloroflexi bacterium]|nr:response regulator [Chloroflexota bacterium]
MHILIVDDEPKVAFFLGRALEHSDRDYSVSITHSGEEALDLFDDRPIDLLVTDLRMPGINGLELIQKMQITNPQMRTILITAYGDGEIEAEARRLQVGRYINKPFPITDLLNAVQEVLME